MDVHRMSRVKRGDLAPEFALEGTDGTPAGRRTYRLSDYRGRAVVLVFYPGDDTPVCTEQLVTYTQEIGRFVALGVQVLASSPQSVASHEAFAANHGGFAFPMLADEDKSVGDAYGVVGPLGFYRRSVVVVDPDGIIRWIHRSMGSMGFQPTDEILAAVDAARGRRR